MTNSPKKPANTPAPRPKLAATIILLREDKGAPQVLLGKRSIRHDFMPSIYVFPGGRVDPADTYAPSSDHLNTRTREILEAALPPARARACALAAVRETFEETNLILGNPEQYEGPAINDPSWKAYFKHGYTPAISGIEVCGRAITPPTRPKRFDTWFFVAKLGEAAANQPIKKTAELVDIGWYHLDAVKDLEMHRITKIMLSEAANFLGREHHPNSVLFSRMIRKTFKFSQFPQ